MKNNKRGRVQGKLKSNATNEAWNQAMTEADHLMGKAYESAGILSFHKEYVRQRDEKRRKEGRDNINRIDEYVIETWRFVNNHRIAIQDGMPIDIDHNLRVSVIDLINYAETDEEREKILAWIRKLSMPKEREKLMLLL
jgi:hypothetical protein